MSEQYNIHVDSSDAGKRIDKFLAEQLPQFSRSRLKSLIESGHLTFQGKICNDCSSLVKEDIEYVLIVPPPISTEMVANAKELDILFEDEHMLVINKPAGLTVHPGAGNHQDTLANALLAHCGDKLSGIGGVQRPGIVHRLDKDTSGLMVVAKNDIAHRHLSNQLATRTLSRTYLALIWGLITPPIGTISANIARSKTNRQKMQIAKIGGKEAITHYKLVHQFVDQAISLIECKLATGRTHQIRVHLTSKGHPLIGDPVYGSGHRKSVKGLDDTAKELLKNFNRQALHSAHIGFIHPVHETNMEFSAPLPEDMQRLIDSLDKV